MNWFITMNLSNKFHEKVNFVTSSFKTQNILFRLKFLDLFYRISDIGIFIMQII